ncbi:unnamed protein product [Owenia fusiformis]|uniref:Uncharacterized protein n=1 Tax=Owenia fusiformis TaxID=6347 RepID=A0A8S4NLY5_OWEFU|nr:unnamed protein product [Owenia fusiformis]
MIPCRDMMRELVLLLFTGVLILTEAACPKNNKDTMKKVQQCMRLLNRHGNPDMGLTGLSTMSGKQWEQRCSDYDATISCITNIVRDCPPRVRETTVGLKALQEGIGQICHDTTMLRRYNEHVVCYRRHEKQTTQCLNKFQDDLKLQIDELNMTPICISFDTSMFCVSQHIQECGSSAVKLFTDLVKKILPKEISDSCEIREYHRAYEVSSHTSTISSHTNQKLAFIMSCVAVIISKQMFTLSL